MKFNLINILFINNTDVNIESGLSIIKRQILLSLTISCLKVQYFHKILNNKYSLNVHSIFYYK